MKVVYFGSFQHYSAYILQALIDAKDIEVVGVVTTPPMPVGRKQIITKTPVHQLAEKHTLPIFTPSRLNSAPANDARSRTPLAGVEDVDLRDEIKNVDYFITAGYGKMLPQSWLDHPTKGCLNLHFSLLPKYRGANPAEWAIMCGETITGISLITMTDKLDGGDILNQAGITINPTDTRETLYEKLYRLGAEKLPNWLVECDTSPLTPPKPQGEGATPYAALLKRDDGFLPWSTIQKSLQKQTLKSSDFPSKHLKNAYTFAGSNDFLYRLSRALAGYPSLWTIVSTTKGDKRMKIISFDPFIVQLEGQQPSHFNQIKNQIIEKI